MKLSCETLKLRKILYSRRIADQTAIIKSSTKIIKANKKMLSKTKIQFKKHCK